MDENRRGAVWLSADKLRTAVQLLALAAFFFLPQQASAAGAFCARPAPGSVVRQPPDLYSAGGVLNVSLEYRTAKDSVGHALFCFVMPGGEQSPTLHVKPGDTLSIKFTNGLPAPRAAAPSEIMSNASNRCGALAMTAASANIHFHGTNTAPTCHSDEVIHTLVNPGETFNYALKIPADEPPGLYWYHPHVHGLSEAALLGGASGAIEVEGIANVQKAVDGLPQRYLVLRDQLVSKPPKNPNKAVPAWDVSLNYVPILFPAYRPAVIRMQAGRKEFWRVVNASADTMIDLQLLYDGKPQRMQIMALDGVALGSQDKVRAEKSQTRTDILLPPAARAEFIMSGPSQSAQSAMLVTRNVNTGPAGDLDPARPLARIEPVLGNGATPPVVLHSGPANPQRFAGLAEAVPTAARKLYFSEVVTPGPNISHQRGTPRWAEGSIAHFFITVDGARPTLFSPDNPPAITTKQGAVEDWTIQNRTGEVHAFHMHQIHFLLLAVNGVAVPKARQQFYDTYPLDFWRGKGAYPSITVRMDFRGPVVGDFVYHCHILEHEDGGMMAIIRVLPRGAATDRHAAENKPYRPWSGGIQALLQRITFWRHPALQSAYQLADAGAAGRPNWTFPAKCAAKAVR